MTFTPFIFALLEVIRPTHSTHSNQMVLAAVQVIMFFEQADQMAIPHATVMNYMMKGWKYQMISSILTRKQ